MADGDPSANAINPKGKPRGPQKGPKEGRFDQEGPFVYSELGRLRAFGPDGFEKAALRSARPGSRTDRLSSGDEAFLLELTADYLKCVVKSNSEGSLNNLNATQGDHDRAQELNQIILLLPCSDAEFTALADLRHTHAAANGMTPDAEPPPPRRDDPKAGLLYNDALVEAESEFMAQHGREPAPPPKRLVIEAKKVIRRTRKAEREAADSFDKQLESLSALKEEEARGHTVDNWRRRGRLLGLIPEEGR